MRALSCGEWNGLAVSLEKELDDATRKTWDEKLRAAFMEPKTLASLNRSDLQDLTWALEHLGEKPEVSHTPWGAWMATGPQWQSLDGAGLAWLADGLKWIGDGAKAERTRLATYVTKDRLASATAVRAFARGLAKAGRVSQYGHGCGGAGILVDPAAACVGRAESPHLARRRRRRAPASGARCGRRQGSGGCHGSLDVGQWRLAVHDGR